MKRVKDWMRRGLALLLCAAALGFFGLTARTGEPMGVAKYITGVIEKEAEKDSPKIALTFDDGPHPYYTEQLLDGLKERGVRASFFVMGKQAESCPELILRMQAEGHLIGNHTYSHLQLSRSNRAAFKAELVKTNELLCSITGEEPQYVRPPYGSWDKSLERELSMVPVFWNVDPLDWCSKDTAGIVRKVMGKVKENAVILMHDEYPTSVTAALQIVDLLQSQGYEFVTVDELLFN